MSSFVKPLLSHTNHASSGASMRAMDASSVCCNACICLSMFAASWSVCVCSSCENALGEALALLLSRSASLESSSCSM